MEPKPNPFNPRGKFVGGRNERATAAAEVESSARTADESPVTISPTSIEVFAAIPPKKPANKKKAKKGAR